MKSGAERRAEVLVVTTLAILTVQLPPGVLAFWGSSETVEDTCPGLRTFPATPSDVYITGLVGVHGGGRCGLVDPVGVQMMEAARWTTLKMAQISLIPATALGVTIYDTCGGEDAVLRAGVSSIVEGGYLDPSHCRPSTPHVGVFHTHPDHPQLSSFLQGLGVPSVSVGHEDLLPQLEALMPLLLHMNWTSVSVAAPSIQVLKQFGHLAATNRICVGAEAILPYVTSDQQGYRDMLQVLESGGTGGVVLVGPQHRLHAALIAAATYNNTHFSWVLAPTGPIQEHVFQGLSKVASGLVAVRRVSQTVPEFSEHFLGVASTDTTLYPPVSQDDYVEEPVVFQVVEAVFKMGVGVRGAVMKGCGGGAGWCSNASVAEFADPHDDGLDVIETFSIKAQRPRYQVLRLDPTDEAGLAFTKVGHFSEGKLEVEKILTEGPGAVSQYPCLSCRCLNVRFAFLAHLRWRYDAWVTICATMAITGFLLTTAISIFIMNRSCRGRAPEGSQGFSLLLLLACVLLYAAILPYSFEASTLTCSLRPFSTSLAYALVFAILLARSLMLATADSDGLVGHVSGLVQTALLFFMVSVQAGIGIQQWVIGAHSTFHTLKPPSGGVLYTCRGDRLHFIIAQSYVMFLLCLQLFLSPFIIRSRRNYHEGLLFFLTTVFIVCVWITWTTLYMLLSPTWSEACVCLGLAATSTCILLTVFVPKTYLMVRAAARDAVCSKTIRPLSRPQSTHDLARSSSLALYDSIGHLPEMMHAYAPDPTMHIPQYKEHQYEAYSHYQPSPRKITQF